MKACIYGAGAIGSWMGMALAQAGCQLSLVARGATLAALQAEGLRLRRPDGSVAQTAVTAHADPAALGVQDLVVLAVKAPGLPDVACAIAPLIGVASWIFDGIFIGALQTRAMLRTMAMSVAVYVAALAALIPLMGNHGLWAALMVLNATRGLTMWRAYPRVIGRD